MRTLHEYLAIDIGASSGRHILGRIENGKLTFEEVYRFENMLKNDNGALTWDIEHLVNEVVNGLAACHEKGYTPYTVAIDTWGVDYVLLDAAGRELMPVYAYRDSRTDGVPQQVEQVISAEDLYARTGIQTQNFNTLYQLWCEKQSGRLAKAAHFLMIPDYLAYRLTGKMANEYTEASTSGLVNAETGEWDTELMQQLGFDPAIFLPLSQPGTALGAFSDEIAARVGFCATVTLAPSHDTASAVAACPLDDSSVYISSGTWSLIGTENRYPVTSEAARLANFTNEGGVEHRFRFLKNIMGMWLFQNIRRNINKSLTYDEMMELARQSGFVGEVDPNDPTFVAPENMLAAMRAALGDPEMPLGDVLNSVYHSLARTYAVAVRDVESISGKEISNILIVGGGSKDVYLNELTERYTGKKVRTGLQEATATGNILSQIMYDTGADLTAARTYVKL